MAQKKHAHVEEKLKNITAGKQIFLKSNLIQILVNKSMFRRTLRISLSRIHVEYIIQFLTGTKTHTHTHFFYFSKYSADKFAFNLINATQPKLQTQLIQKLNEAVCFYIYYVLIRFI